MTKPFRQCRFTEKHAPLTHATHAYEPQAPLPDQAESGMDHLFLKSVYCLSGLGIVKKNRRIPKNMNSKKVYAFKRTHCFYIELCSFFTIL